MRRIIQDKNCFAFQDADGVLSFSIKSYEGQELNPRFLFDGVSQAFLLRCPGQVILLADLTEEAVANLNKAQKVRFFETPENSSEIIRQYETGITKIECVPLDENQIIPEDEMFFPCSD